MKNILAADCAVCLIVLCL